MFDVSIVDFVGVVEGGVAVTLSLLSGGTSHEVLYWFNNNLDYRLVVGDDLSDQLVGSIYDQPWLPYLVRHIDRDVLPPRVEIFSEFPI